MNRRPCLAPLVSLALLGVALAVAGCASRADLDARYDASLQRWQGATRAELEAAWGRPVLVEPSDGGTAITWVVRTDLDSRPAPDGSPTVVVAPGRNGGSPSVAVVSGTPSPAPLPITCVTRFLLKEGRVVSWKFEGLGCGAPF